jgi:ribosomal protein S18 acetylase RimI-like enzyme
LEGQKKSGEFNELLLETRFWRIGDRLQAEGFMARENTRERTAARIVSYEPAYRDDFRRLNVEWLEKFFYVEEIDDRVLSDPETHILNSGGFIFFALIGQDVVGTAALIKAEGDRYELSKMAVTQAFKGLGIGRKLALAAIRKFEETGARELYLESNSRLTPALSLYESLGFVHRPAREGSEYKRADVYMLYCPDGTP